MPSTGDNLNATDAAMTPCVYQTSVCFTWPNLMERQRHWIPKDNGMIRAFLVRFCLCCEPVTSYLANDSGRRQELSMIHKTFIEQLAESICQLTRKAHVGVVNQRSIVKDMMQHCNSSRLKESFLPASYNEQ
ncbi:hypothetical protein C2845_PM11G16160 [Panicum miliaceum]|uniref:Uncharacterized protein n=1 Tax=Panicum miliaceum TaxID=4540 RepID=A0A3L6RRW2_PANMI|nr:hypothetical protein C2845_PM11G16160 [Panicum miliaceum]